MPEKTASARGRMDQQLAQAVDFARENAVEVGGEASVGEHLSFEMNAERLGTHYFACNDAGYVGWCWSVTLTRVPRSRKITVCEVDLVPGSGALLAPEWLPWEDRLQPGDVSREDVLPYRDDDDRLISGLEDTGEDPDLPTDRELGLGRVRVLSDKGHDDAAKRWYASERGPKRGRRPKQTCSTCGFLMKMSGSMRLVFGVCANEWAQDDGCVVSLDHTCGAHSETDVPNNGTDWPVRPSRINDFLVESERIGS